MIAFLIGAVIGAISGAGIVLGILSEGYTVLKKQDFQEREVVADAMRSRLNTLTAENANLRVALAAGGMTEEGKKVAAMTMDALDGVAASEKVA